MGAVASRPFETDLENDRLSRKSSDGVTCGMKVGLSGERGGSGLILPVGTVRLPPAVSIPTGA